MAKFDGIHDGIQDGALVGIKIGKSEGTNVGSIEGYRDIIGVGIRLGLWDGIKDR